MESDPSMEAEFHPAGDDLSVGRKAHEMEEPVHPVEESNGTNGNGEGPEEIAAATPHTEPEAAKVNEEPVMENEQPTAAAGETVAEEPTIPEAAPVPEVSTEPEITPEPEEAMEVDSNEQEVEKPVEEEEKATAEEKATSEEKVDAEDKVETEAQPEVEAPSSSDPFDCLMTEGEKKKVETKVEEVKTEETETKEGESEEKTEEKSEINEDGGETKEDESTEKKDKEVFEVDDDGKDFESSKVTPDEDYFATVAVEEVEWYKEHAPDHNKKVQCTSCFKQVSHEFKTNNGVYRHPLLAVCICKACNNYYSDGEWAKDEDGADVFCRWCGQGGDLMLCDKCPHAFCKKCLQRNLGRKAVSEIGSSEEWRCLVCDPKQIYEQRALYFALFTHQQEIKASRPPKKENTGARRKSAPVAAPKPVEETKPEEPELVYSAESFISENFIETLKTLEAFQATMSEEQTRWTDANMELNSEIATTITRKLRKFYTTTKQTMEVLDRALATGYVKKFPEEAKRIHMGKTDEVIEAESEFGGICAKKPKDVAAATVARPKKKKRPAPKKAAAAPAKKVVATPKKKVLPKKKAVKAKPAAVPASKARPASKTVAGPKSRTKAVSNGGSSKSYVTPSLMGSKKKKGTPATKVSAKLFKGKKRPAPSSAATVDSDESDIEIVADIQPPAAKKKKIGPKSRVR